MKNRILPPTYFMVFLLLSIGFHFIFPIRRLIFNPYTYLGIIPIVLGIILNIWSDQLLKKRKTTVKPFEKPTSLETSGPFKISRHPMYFGMILVLLGVSIAFGSLITFIFPVIFTIITERVFIPIEEENLEKAFGKKYFDYKSKVRKWL